MVQKSQPGYIIVLTMLIISTAMFLITYIVNRGYYAIPAATVAVSREKAKMLALSGIQVALSRLAGKPIDKKQAATPQPGQQPSQIDKSTKYFLEQVLPHLNRFQTFTLTEQRDGIDGIISIVISSEAGKINPNNFYDFKKKEFKGAKEKDGGLKKQLETILNGVGQQAAMPNMVAALEKFYKQRGEPLQEVTELLTIPEFQVFQDKLYYEPLTKAQPVPSSAQQQVQKVPVYLTDIFTVYNDQAHVDPWLFSNSIAAGLGLKTAIPNDTQQRRELIKTLEKNFKPYAAWSKDWDKLMNQWLGKPFAALPKGIEPLLSTTFAPQYFSVLSIGTYRKVSIRVFAIVEVVKKEYKEKTASEVTVKKLYWL